MDELRGMLHEVIADVDRQAAQGDEARWSQQGFPAALAKSLSGIPALASALDIIEVAHAQGLPVRRVAEVHYALGEALHLKWLMDKIEELPVEGRWHAHARGMLRDELYAQQHVLVEQVLQGQAAKNGREQVLAWMTRNDQGLRYTLSMFADMKSQLVMDDPTVSVAVRRLAQLAAAGRRVEA
jgi:glutamate dehydrogenase